MNINEELVFIEETLINAIDWAAYADDYFKEKHNLNQDKEDVRKSIEIIHGMDDKIKSLLKDIEYWKNSFHKEIEAKRK